MRNGPRNVSRGKARVPNGGGGSGGSGGVREEVLENLPNLYKAMRGNDWRERRTALGTCADTLLKVRGEGGEKGQASSLSW